jgi:hypothetical protein
MGVMQVTKPIQVLDFFNFYPKNLQTSHALIFTRKPNIGRDLAQSEPCQNRRLCRITTNTSLCVEEAQL